MRTLSNVEVDEDELSVVMNVNIVSTQLFTALVLWATADDEGNNEAIAGEDYESRSGTLEWEAATQTCCGRFGFQL